MKKLKLIAVIVGFVLTMAACGSSGSSTDTQPVDIALADFMIMPHDVSAKAGRVVFHVHNDGKTPHNFRVTSASGETLGTSKDLDAGESTDFEVDLQPRVYPTICAKPGHSSLGMRATLTVTSA